MNNSRTFQALAGLSIVGLLFAMTGCTSRDENDQDVALSDLFSSAEQQREVAECLRDRGWNAEFDEGSNAVVTEFTDEQSALYEKDSEECVKESGFEADSKLTTDQFQVTFDWYTEIGECLDSAGWSVPERPSFQTFQSTYETEPWIPWLEVPSEELENAREQCPVLNIPR